MRYRIYKADINHYRVLAVPTGSQTGVLDPKVYRYLTIVDPVFKVDHKGYVKAKEKGFPNSGDPMDYFAWIECSEWHNGVIFRATHQVKFNPFKADFFYFAKTGVEIKSASVCTIFGNSLFINK